MAEKNDRLTTFRTERDTHQEPGQKQVYAKANVGAEAHRTLHRLPWLETHLMLPYTESGLLSTQMGSNSPGSQRVIQKMRGMETKRSWKELLWERGNSSLVRRAPTNHHRSCQRIAYIRQGQQGFPEVTRRVRADVIAKALLVNLEKQNKKLGMCVSKLSVMFALTESGNRGRRTAYVSSHEEPFFSGLFLLPLGLLEATEVPSVGILRDTIQRASVV